MDYRKELLAIADEGNAKFSKSLTPGDDHEFLGARVPNLRKLAKKIAKEDLDGYLKEWKYEYFEDAMLLGMVIGYADVDLDARLKMYDRFVPIINNWAVCDSACSTWKPKEKEKEKIWNYLMKNLRSGKEFRMRFAVVEMMDDFIDDGHIDKIIALMDGTKHDGYYFKMAAAWCLSFCFVKYPEKTMEYLEGKNNLDVWTYNKSIQKIIESYRVDDKTKNKLRKMKIKQRGF